MAWPTLVVLSGLANGEAAAYPSGESYCIMTWIDLVWKVSSQVTYWNAIVILAIYASWFDS